MQLVDCGTSRSSNSKLWPLTSCCTHNISEKVRKGGSDKLTSEPRRPETPKLETPSMLDHVFS